MKKELKSYLISAVVMTPFVVIPSLFIEFETGELVMYLCGILAAQAQHYAVEHFNRDRRTKIVVTTASEYREPGDVVVFSDGDEYLVTSVEISESPGLLKTTLVRQ